MMDLNKLRDFHRAFKDASGALRDVSGKYQDALYARNRARDALAIIEDPIRGKGREKELKAARQTFRDAQIRFEKIDEDIARLQQLSNHAGRIWVRCRDYAREQGVLPVDMED
ncbi:hypothetical protein [Rhizobium lentis]|uniref:hypothetical protein n=1 Tax=Rhizobium lentis TaxID=1138194 RepID=UPI001C82B83F|nr:hypothetical protein [Rhizobium lentis]MBX5144965.1 hypothetical protein [Rhizobium lentis]